MATIYIKNSDDLIKPNELVLAFSVSFSPPLPTNFSDIPLCDTGIYDSGSSDIYFAPDDPLA